MPDKLYRRLAQTVDARRRCMQDIKPDFADHHREWFSRHTEMIKHLVREHLPSGSGFDNGTTIDLDASHADRLIFHTSFHHMNDNGMYDGWTEHDVVVTPSLAFGFTVKVTGKDRSEIKDYIGEVFHTDLSKEVE